MGHREIDYSHWRKNSVLFLGSQTISLLGSSLVQYAITWHLTLSERSGMIMMLSVLFGFLPIFVLAPFAGVWADRFNRKKLIILSDGFIALSTLGLVFLFSRGYGTVGVLLTALAIRAVGSGIQMPAVSAVLPQIVPTNHLNQINGINGSIQAAITLISPMLSGALMNFTSMENIFWIDVITATAAILILQLLLKIPGYTKGNETSEQGVHRYAQELQLGYQYIKHHAFLRKLFLYFAVAFLMIAPVAFLTPLQVTRNFGGDIWRLSALEIVFAVGMILGGLGIALWGGFKNRIVSIAAALGIIGMGSLLLGIVTNFWIYLFFMGLVGVAMPMLNAPSLTLIQEKVEEAYLGRVFGVQTMIFTSMMPLGMVFFGPLADRIDIQWLLIISGFALLLIAFYLFRDKKLIKEGEPSAE